MSSFFVFVPFASVTPSKLEKILHLCIFTNKNNGIGVQDHSRGHAILQSLNKMKKRKEKNNSREEKEIKRGPQNKAAQSIFIVVQDFYF